MRRRALSLLAAALLAGAGPARGDAEIQRLDPRFDTLVPADAAIEKLADGFRWLEGPVWYPREQALLFSDVARNAVFRWRAGGEPAVFLEPSGYSGAALFAGREPGSNGLALDAEGRLVLCQHGDRRVARLELDGTLTALAERYAGKRLNSPNDLVFARNGDLYFSDPPFGLPGTFEDPARELSFSGVYRLAPDGTLTLLTDQLRAPNGVALSPDERTFYVSNSDRERPLWMAFPIGADGRLGSGVTFFDGRALAARWPGLPDGMEVDAAGNVFAAGPGGVHVFDAQGRQLGSLLLGSATSNVAFGASGRELYVSAGPALYRVRLAGPAR